MKVALINPNANADTTRMMVTIAQAESDALDIHGFTAAEGPPIIQDPAALAASVAQVRRVAAGLCGYDGVIVSAFGDPGAAGLDAEMPVPVIGIGAAAARAAAAPGQPFAVVTTTPDLAPAIDRLMRAQGRAAPYLGTFLTGGEVAALMAAPTVLEAALLVEIRRAAAAGAARIIIGGGPLGQVAERLKEQAPVPLVNPIAAAVRAMAVRLRASGQGAG